MAAHGVRVLSNHFEMKHIPNKTILQYEAIEGVDAGPKGTTRRVEIIRRMQTKTHANMFRHRSWYDGTSILYSAEDLNIGPEGTAFSVNMSDFPNPGPRSIKTVRIRSTTGRVSLTSVADLVMNRRASNESIAAVTVLQLILRAPSNEQFTSNGKSFFAKGSAKAIAGGLELWRGFFLSVRPVIGKVLINVDTTVGLMVRSGNAVQVALDFLGTSNIRDLQLRADSKTFRDLQTFFKNIQIEIPGQRGKRLKRIRALQAHAGQYSFVTADGHEATVAEHFQMQHNTHIRYPAIIGVVTTGKSLEPRRDVIPLECCTIIGGQFHKGKVGPDTIKDVIKVAAMRPNDKRMAIEKGDPKQTFDSPIRTFTRSEYIMNAGFRVSESLGVLTGRFLPQPQLEYAHKQMINPRDGAWNAVNSQFYQPCQLGRWAAINFDGSRTPQNNFASRIIPNLGMACQSLGMDVGQPIIGTGNPAHPESALEAVYQQGGPNNTPQIIVILLPNKAEDLRNAIKHWGDTARGVLTQCMQSGKNMNDQYLKNVALKINARLGGYNALARSPGLNELQSVPFMIMGIDVSHPGPGSFHPSIAGLVFSHDQKGHQYTAFTALQKSRVERIDKLKYMVYDALVNFSQRHGRPPRRVIIYRDGISEGEFDNVGQGEIQDIDAAINKLLQSENGRKFANERDAPKVTYIIVGKRHHVVFFPEDRSQGDRNGNVRAGFATLEGLSNPLKTDFYLQSHQAIQGTARSAHYTILKDQNYGSDVTKLQELSYSLCHAYAKATRSVSIPAPVYYADLVCARGKFHYTMDMPSSESGSDGGSQISIDTRRQQGLDVGSQHWRQLHPSIGRTMYFI